MSTALVSSQIVLWIVVLLLIASNLLLLRQIGVLYERIAPAGALATNAVLKKGSEILQRREADVSGDAVMIGGKHRDGKSQLLFFAAPDCPVCKSVLPAVLSLAGRERSHVELILASAGDGKAEHTAFRQAEGLEAYPYILSDRLGMELGVSKLPYAVLLDPEGRVNAFGLVNSREHLESLFEAQDRDVVSIQEYMQRADEPGAGSIGPSTVQKGGYHDFPAG
jgi:methylamine dehydrogenase accessory protein MauD